MKFVANEAALQLGRTLVMADLHLGIEHDFRMAGMRMPSQTAGITERITGLINKTKSSRLIILGDIKHKVPGSSFQEMRELPAFFDALARHAGIAVIPGNHDAGLGSMLHGIRFYPSSGMRIGSTYLCHGHALPAKGFLNARRLVIGHAHPVVELVDKLGYRWTQKVWLRAKPLKQKLDSDARLEEIIVMPAFSDFVGGKPVNNSMKPLGPVMKLADIGSSDVYLLDGTFIGRLDEL